MDIIIESTKSFEKDLAQLSTKDKSLVIEKINTCAELFPIDKVSVYQKMQTMQMPSLINSYESSLYTLGVSQKLRVILSVDEDPIFAQTVFTLFRLVQDTELSKAYISVAELLYQELTAQKQTVEAV